MCRLLLPCFILLHLFSQTLCETKRTDSPVLIGHFNIDRLIQVRSLNENERPAKLTIIQQKPNPDEELSFAKRDSSCNFASQCSTGSCCTAALGKTEGTCFSANTGRCCSSDGNILPVSISTNLTGECCSYDSGSNTFTSCPPSGDTTHTRCSDGTSCTSACSSSSGCSGGDSCCLAPASTDPSSGKCYSAARSEVCCFDGRICSSSLCSLVSDGQCCGVDQATQLYSYCPNSSFCNVDSSNNIICTTLAYGVGTGNFTGNLQLMSGTGDSSSSSHLRLILGICIPVGIVVAAIIVGVAFVIHKRRKPKAVERIVQPTIPPQYKQSAESLPPSMYAAGGDYQKFSINQGQSTVSMPNAPPSYTAVVRPDGGLYAPMEAITNGSMRGLHTAIDWSEIQMITSIGHGSFGEAYKAKWHEAVVAVKKINADLLSNTEAVNNFYGETEILKSLKPHPNTVLFFGVTKEPIAIIMEYCENGSLHQYLRSAAAISTSMQRSFLLGIARGMLHLHFYNVIHRDLAARNILLTSTFEPKVSDFGFSRELEGPNENHIKTSVGPVYWFPPEALRDHVFSTKTDVWSFGVVIWEVVTRQEPFADKTVAEVLTGVIQNQMTVEIPSNCPPQFASLMRMCFQQNPNDRPNFKEICSILESEPAQTVTA